MKAYIQSLKDILENGHAHEDRTGVGRVSIFGYQERYNLANGFPLVTTRSIATGAMVSELLWFIKGETNTKKGGCPRFWDRWAVEEHHVKDVVSKLVGRPFDDKDVVCTSLLKNIMEKVGHDIGPMYGHIWRNAPVTQEKTYQERSFSELPSDKLELYKKEYDELRFLTRGNNGDANSFEDYALGRYYQTVDQLNELVHNLKNRPFSSRHCITAWIPEFVPPETISPQEATIYGYGCLAPCHAFFQFFVRPGAGGKRYLDCQMYQRSCDVPIGKPYNISQYALLQSMIAQVVDMTPGDLIVTTGDLHIYANQMDGVRGQILREPKPLPTLWLNPEINDLFKFTKDDIKIVGYDPHPEIVYPVAV